MAYNTYNKYRIHAENGLTSGADQNLETNAEYIADTERDNGCAANTVIKKNLINTGLRESTLFAASFVDLLCSSTREFGPNDTLDDTKTNILDGLKSILLNSSYDSAFGSVNVNSTLSVDTIDSFNEDEISILDDVAITGALSVTGAVTIGSTLDVTGLLTGSLADITNATFDTISAKTNASTIGSASSKFATVYASNLQADTASIAGLLLVDSISNSSSSSIDLGKTLLPSLSDIDLGDLGHKFNKIWANTFYGALSGNASTATKLDGTNAGNTSTPVFFDNGNPTECSHHVYNQLTSSTYVEIQSSSDGSTPIYRSSGNMFTLKKGVYHFTFSTTGYSMFKNASATVATIVIPEDKNIGLLSENSTVYTVDSFFSWYYYDSNWSRQQWLYTRLKLQHTTGSDRVQVYLQLGVGYYSGSSLQLTWDDMKLTSVTAIHFS